ncbi:hypothetical protein A2572_03415 [Candidatus Collierbacteria bacterium RIFOXYD1_FULL_40_9]|uniref:LytR/CpsA/Psr regulator C-terminal domain-containing protein n=1 Tax=Candidatus Collierbacteria bacterium RIFOXYD1_FULL_40_9 TaxID=1817731 RepID=A0A1F5FX88_9BACT|nr:MAG: hypothetical protein A2572_03415 [Candidatus Collierbacteria bacterium RIFOXYD1_FULL_40_9]
MQYPLSEKKKDIFLFLTRLLLFVLILFVVFGLRFLYVNKSRYDLQTVELEKVSEVKQKDEAMPAEAPKRKFIVKVINSSGRTGLAAKTIEEIKSAGFEIDSSTGNGVARSGSKISFKQPEIVSLAIGDYLKKKLPTATVEISLTQQEDIVIDLGK